jgi:4-hydroxy-tetrahydrodipicolinate synthase
VKDASADLVQASVIVRDAPTSCCVLSGDDPTALAAMAVGGKGVISVIANAFPRTFSDMIRAVRKGKIHIANQLHHQLLDLQHWLYVEGNPVGIKEAVAYKGLSSSELRLPLVRMNAANRKRLHEEMDKLGDKA